MDRELQEARPPGGPSRSPGSSPVTTFCCPQPRQRSDKFTHLTGEETEVQGPDSAHPGLTAVSHWGGGGGWHVLPLRGSIHMLSRCF